MTLRTMVSSETATTLMSCVRLIDNALPFAMNFVGAVRFSRVARYANTVSRDPRVVSRSSKVTVIFPAACAPFPSSMRNRLRAAFFAALDGVAEMYLPESRIPKDDVDTLKDRLSCIFFGMAVGAVGADGTRSRDPHLQSAAAKKSGGAPKPFFTAFLHFLSDPSTKGRPMSFNRLDYDPCTYRADLDQSVGPGNYLVATPGPHCLPCFSGDPWVQSGGADSTCASRSLVDVDSELHNLTRPATNCPSGLYHPGKEPFCATRTDFPDCRTTVATDDTRLNDPPCTLRGTGWNRWQWLCTDPQDRVQMPFDWNIDSKLVSKDAHRPCIPSPIDQLAVMPPDYGNSDIESWRPTCPPPAPLSSAPRVDWRSCSSLHQQ